MFVTCRQSGPYVHGQLASVIWGAFGGVFILLPVMWRVAVHAQSSFGPASRKMIMNTIR